MLANYPVDFPLPFIPRLFFVSGEAQSQKHAKIYATVLTGEQYYNSSIVTYHFTNKEAT